MKIDKLNKNVSYIVIKKRNGQKYRCFIDAGCADIVRGFNWHISSNGYVRSQIQGIDYAMPAILGGTRTDFEKVYDHLNRDKLDNRTKNLLYCTWTENNANRRWKRNTKYTGICYDKATRAFRVRDKITGKHRGVAKLDRAIIYGLASAMYFFQDWDKAKKFVGVKIDPRKEKLVQAMVYLVMCEAYLELTMA